MSHELTGTDASMILVLGETGAGKSFLIDKLAPGKVIIGHGLESCTQVSKLVATKVGSTEVLLIDTPGFDDTIRSDADILLEISKTLTAQYRLEIKLKGVIFVHNLNAGRMRGSSMRQLEIFKRICGPEAFPNVLLVTTHWTNDSSLYIRELDLLTNYWESMIDQGVRAMRFDGTEDSAVAIVSQLLAKDDVVLALQREIVDQGRGRLSDTTAGAFATEARRDAMMQHEQLNLGRRNENVNASVTVKLSDLKTYLERSDRDETKLKIDVGEAIQQQIEITVKQEVKRQRRKPTVVNIISWIINCVSIGLGAAGLA